ncbi:MAG: single-stranded-DNA-specific exonuclease RecJ [Bacteroidetes bacterium]|nr:MAG: single-stranded-DNA-specific exonuclease RecJ [Bacteroidota bacterium]
MRKFQWKLKSIDDEALIDRLRTELNDLPSELAQMLVQRGVTSFDEAHFFFRAKLEDLHDPMLMTGMNDAVDRILGAIENEDQIFVYGDYDVDGTTSTALLTGFLKSLGSRVEFFVPNRFEHGYGLSRQGIDVCAEGGANLIVALDCGITAIQEAEYAKSLGIDLIICDHHTPHDRLPDAVAVLDPKRDDCTYPFKDLCGCGVTFKLVQALLSALKKDPEEAVPYLDLVALATAADVVSVTGENRILLREGIERLRSDPRVGIRALAEESRTRLSDCTVTSIVFGIGPRINAAGRLGDAGRAVSLLMTNDAVEAAARARQLERLNQERRVLDKETLDEAVLMAERLLLSSDRHSIVLHQADWHMGVIGIVASRLVDRFYRPTVMLTTVNGKAKGSARSINGINVFEAIRSCEDILSEFGGHDYAAGLSLPVENIEEFIRRFEEGVSSQVSPELMDPVIHLDAKLSFRSIDKRFWAVLKQFEPFGPDNSQPLFLTTNLMVSGEPKTVGRDNTHLKFSVRERDQSGVDRDVIGFRMSEYLDILVESSETNSPIELVYSLEENTWNGRTSIQLRAKDLRLTNTEEPVSRSE